VPYVLPVCISVPGLLAKYTTQTSPGLPAEDWSAVDRGPGRSARKNVYPELHAASKSPQSRAEPAASSSEPGSSTCGPSGAGVAATWSVGCHGVSVVTVAGFDQVAPPSVDLAKRMLAICLPFCFVLSHVT
jgi:hypothetical protein